MGRRRVVTTEPRRGNRRPDRRRPRTHRGPARPGARRARLRPAEGLQHGPELDALRTPGGFRGAEGEDEAAGRGLAALEALAEESRGGRVLVVAHGSLLRVSLSRAVGRTLPSVDNAVLNLAHHHPAEGWNLEFFNGERLTAAVG